MSKTRESIIENQLHGEHQLSRALRSVFTCHVPDLLSRRCNFVGRSYVTCTVRWVDGVDLARKKGRLLSILATGSSHRPEWARCTLGGLMGVEPLIALPPRVLVAGRLQCGAARAGVRRGHGECAELAHLARGSSKLFTARHAENGPFSREVGQNTIRSQRVTKILWCGFRVPWDTTACYLSRA